MAATSEPACFSDNAKAASHSPDRAFGRMAARNSGEPAMAMAPEPSPCIANAKVGEPVVRGQRLARQTHGARIDVRSITFGGRDGSLQ